MIRKKRSILNKIAGGAAVDLGHAVGRLSVEYDFAVSGGAVSTIVIEKAALPANAVVVAATIDHITACTSGGSATVAIKAEGAGDILGATAVASMTGLVIGAPAATPFKTTVERDISVVIAVAALTAGKFRVHLHYFISEPQS